ncbi:MAG TPA: hypothetical protein VN956_06005, partial [Pyrinomonadaceae bacterium]|nr:hypothetical protein [Pyrinomonadaceae bacterium]
ITTQMLARISSFLITVLSFHGSSELPCDLAAAYIADRTLSTDFLRVKLIFRGDDNPKNVASQNRGQKPLL